MPTPTQEAIDAAKNLNNLGFVEFTTGLLDGVYQTIVSHQVSQLEEYSELVAQVSGTVEEFVLNTVGLDIADGANASSAQNLPPLNSYIDDVLLLDSTAQTAEVSANVAQHFAPAATLEDGTEISLSDLREHVFNKLKADNRQQYDLLVEIIRIGYARLDTTGGYIETGLDFRVTSDDLKTSASRNTDIRANSWYANGTVAAAFPNWGFRVNGGYAASRLRVNTASATALSSVTSDIRMTGKVRVDFATSTFDTTMARIRREDD